MELYQNVKVLFSNNSNNSIILSLSLVDDIDNVNIIENIETIWLVRDKYISENSLQELCEFIIKYKQHNKLNFNLHSNLPDIYHKTLTFKFNNDNVYQNTISIVINYTETT
jgi:hypothetical protein